MQKDCCQQKPAELLQGAVSTAIAALYAMLECDPHSPLEHPAVDHRQPTMTWRLLDALGAAISAAGTLLRGTDVVRWAAHSLSNNAQTQPRTT